jgi:SAM-dependent methyltransferase
MVLDVGAGGMPYRDLFPHVGSYVAMDIPPSPNMDVYGDGMALPFRDATFDSVLCNEVLEHVPEPASLMGEVARVLRPGGVLLLSTPQTWGLHAEPYDFYRYTKYGLDYLSRKAGLEVIEITATSGLWGTFAQRIADTVVYTYAAKSSPRVRDLLGISLAPLLLSGRALDRVAGKRGDTLDNVLVARKPGTDVAAGTG